MKMQLNKIKLGLISVVSAGLLSSPAGATIKDVLDTPAVKTSEAATHLLVDIDKAGDRLVSVGARGHIIYSDDAGKTWQQAYVPVSVLLTAVSFVDDKHGWAVGHSGVILHTEDGGKTWVTQFDGNQANTMVISQIEARVERIESQLEEASEDEQEELEYQLEEASFSLEDAKVDAQEGASKPFLDVLFSSRNEGFAVGAYGYFFKTKNGGLTWENYGSRIQNPDRFHLNAINRIKGGALFIVGEAGTIFRSKDAGESWELLDSPYEGSLFGVSGTNTRDAVMVLGLRGHLFRSDSAGDSWDEVAAGTESTLMSASVNDNGQISIVGNSGSILFSRDGGRTFTETIREDRLSNTAAVFVNEQVVALVGESGVNLVQSNGAPVK